MNSKPLTYKRKAEQMTMRDRRMSKVKDLSPRDCRKLLSHHHGIGYNSMRRKAYLLKSAEENWTAYFNATEASAIQMWIENENTPQANGAGFPVYSSAKE